MTMNVSIGPQLEELVRSKVESGLYNSASEVVRDALRLLEAYDSVRDRALESLRRDLEEGQRDLDAGRVSDFDPEAVKQRGRERLRAKKKATR